MKISIKRTGVVLVLTVCLMLACLCMSLVCANTATALDEDNVGTHWFYDELNDLGKKFYNTLGTLKANGDFKDGQLSYNLVENGVVSSADVENYVKNKDYTLPLAFSAARDAFFMDNPDLFYVDLYKIVLGAGKRNGQYLALLDTGNYKSLYFDGGFSSEAQVTAAVTEYEAKVSQIANLANAKTSDKEKVEFVNEYLCKNVSYDYDSFNFIKENNANHAFASNAYGALVNGKAVCIGYGRAFKAVLDKLGIPCVCVQGYSLRPGSEVQEAHLWNQVKVDGKWYAVDVTWNDTMNEPKPDTAAVAAEEEHAVTYRYLLVGANVMDIDHIADGVISTSNYEMYYPMLNPYPFGVDENNDGIKVETKYVDVVMTEATETQPADIAKELEITVSYNGLGATNLAEQGLYLAFRYSYNDANKDNRFTTILWQQVTVYKEYSGLGDNSVDIKDTFVKLHATSAMDNIEFAVFNKPADGAVTPGYESMGISLPYYYNPANLEDSNIYATSEIIANDAFGTYQPKPHPEKTNPTTNTALHIEDSHHITVTYDQKLIKIDENAEIGIEVVTKFNDIHKYIKLTNAELSADGKTVSFDFKASNMYHHNYADYSFYPTNLIGEESGKTPKCITHRFIFYTTGVEKRVTYTCMKYGHSWTTGGYATSYGQPKLISDTDMSDTGFTDIMGNNREYGQDQRAQLLLVASEPGESDTDVMNRLLSNGNENVTAAYGNDIKKASTYEIEMMVCQNKIKEIPNGYSLQLGVGFPGEYDYNSPSVVYKAYHYKRNAAGEIVSIEEVPCIVTERGLIISVNSFSPFMIVALDAESNAAKSEEKKIYVSTQDTFGGKVFYRENDSEKTAVTSVKTGEKVKYFVAPDEGYKIDKITINGAEVTLNAETDPNNAKVAYTFEVNENELTAKDNVLEAAFVLEAAEARYEEAGIEIENVPVILISDADETAFKANAKAHADAYDPSAVQQPTEPNPHEPTGPNPDASGDTNLTTSNSHTGLIVGVCVGAVALVAIAVAVILVLKKRKPKRQ